MINSLTVTGNIYSVTNNTNWVWLKMKHLFFNSDREALFCNIVLI